MRLILSKPLLTNLTYDKYASVGDKGLFRIIHHNIAFEVFEKMLIRWGGYPLGILPIATMLQNYRQVDSGVHSSVQAHSFHYYARFSRYESFNLQPLDEANRI